MSRKKEDASQILALTKQYPNAFQKATWLHDYYRSILSRFEMGRAPNAILLSGEKGVGQRELGLELAKALLCQTPNQADLPQACDACQSCAWFNAEHHPDLIYLGGGREIKVDEIRTIQKFSVTKGESARKIVFLDEAERMNVSAANSLLKILEEPPSHLTFILTVERPRELPATILSRSQHYPILSPSENSVVAWLQNELTLNADTATLLYKLCFNSPFGALARYDVNFFSGVEEMAIKLLNFLTVPSQAVKELEALVKDETKTTLLFELLFLALRDALYKTPTLPVLEGMVRYFSRIPAKNRLTRYERLVSIYADRHKQTRLDYALEAWFLNR